MKKFLVSALSLLVVGVSAVQPAKAEYVEIPGKTPDGGSYVLLNSRKTYIKEFRDHPLDFVVFEYKLSFPMSEYYLETGFASCASPTYWVAQDLDEPGTTKRVVSSIADVNLLKYACDFRK